MTKSASTKTPDKAAKLSLSPTLISDTHTASFSLMIGMIPISNKANKVSRAFK